MAVEGLHVFNDAVDVVSGVGAINLLDILRRNGVEFQDVVVDQHQCVVYLLAVNHSRIGEHADLSLRTVLVAQADGVADDFGKMRLLGTPQRIGPVLLGLGPVLVGHLIDAEGALHQRLEERNHAR